MPSVVTKVVNTAVLLTIINLLTSCTSQKYIQVPPLTASSAVVQVVQPFNEDDHLATVKILKIKECYIPENCSHIVTGREDLAYFEFTHKNTSDNQKYRALREHFYGVKSGDIIEAYIIAERQKNGNTLIKIYEYSAIKNPIQKSSK